MSQFLDHLTDTHTPCRTFEELCWRGLIDGYAPRFTRFVNVLGALEEHNYEVATLEWAFNLQMKMWGADQRCHIEIHDAKGVDFRLP